MDVVEQTACVASQPVLRLTKSQSFLPSLVLKDPDSRSHAPFFHLKSVNLPSTICMVMVLSAPADGAGGVGAEGAPSACMDIHSRWNRPHLDSNHQAPRHTEAHISGIDPANVPWSAEGQ